MGIHGRHVLEAQSPQRIEEQGIVRAHDLVVARELIERGRIEVVHLSLVLNRLDEIVENLQ